MSPYISLAVWRSPLKQPRIECINYKCTSSHTFTSLMTFELKRHNCSPIHKAKQFDNLLANISVQSSGVTTLPYQIMKTLNPKHSAEVLYINCELIMSSFLRRMAFHLKQPNKEFPHLKGWHKHRFDVGSILDSHGCYLSGLQVSLCSISEVCYSQYWLQVVGESRPKPALGSPMTPLPCLWWHTGH